MKARTAEVIFALLSYACIFGLIYCVFELLRPGIMGVLND